MREVICLHSGQAGVQLGNAVWELFGLEHGLPVDGKIPMDKLNNHGFRDSLMDTFYCDTGKGKLVPRSFLLDLEPTVVDEVRVGSYRQLFNPEQMISGTEDAASNYARGHFTKGKEMMNLVLNRIRLALNQCDAPQSFIFFNSYGGGTGSGFTSLLLRRLCDDHAKMLKINFDVYPSPQIASAILEPYNTILSLQQKSNLSDCCFNIDNEALYELCQRNLSNCNPTFTTVNRLATQVISCLTVCLRFASSLNMDLNQFQTNLVPYPKIHFPIISYSPVISAEKAYHEKASCNEITRCLFKPHYQMMKCNPRQGKYMAVCLIYRGDITPREVNQSIQMLKEEEALQFVDWCPTGFKYGVNNQCPVTVPGSDMGSVRRAVGMCTNSTVMSKVIERVSTKFKSMFHKRAYVHWYVGEGMEEGEFMEALEEISSLQKDYDEVGQSTPEEEETERTRTPNPETGAPSSNVKKPIVGKKATTQSRNSQQSQQSREISTTASQEPDDKTVTKVESMGSSRTLSKAGSEKRLSTRQSSGAKQSEVEGTTRESAAQEEEDAGAGEAGGEVTSEGEGEDGGGGEGEVYTAEGGEGGEEVYSGEGGEGGEGEVYSGEEGGDGEEGGEGAGEGGGEEQGETYGGESAVETEEEEENAGGQGVSGVESGNEETPEDNGGGGDEEEGFGGGGEVEQTDNEEDEEI